MTTEIALPTNIPLPAHLQTPDAVARIAAENAAAAGGIKIGGFARISIEGSKFHEIDPAIDGGAARTYLNPAQPGQPQLPMMCLEIVVIAWNPALTKLYYKGKWTKGADNAPDCSSSNGVTPDSWIVAPQHSNCANCEQNKWGSKISEVSGKEVKACTDLKQLVVLPAADLTYKALGLAVTPAALGDFGKYVQALTERGWPISSVVTNVTFDSTASFPKLKFAFNRFLTAEQDAACRERAKGSDVKMIVAPSRVIAAPGLPAPAAQPQLPAPNTNMAPPASVTAPPPVAPVSTGVQFPPETASFGAPPQGVGQQPPAGFVQSTGATPPAPTEPPKRTRRTRAQIEADKAAASPSTGMIPGVLLTASGAPGMTPGAPAADLSHLPPAILAAIQAGGGINSPAGQALLAAYPAPGQPVAAPVAPVQPAPAPAPTPTPLVAPTAGFGAAAAPTQPAAPSAATVQAGSDIAEKLRARLASFGKPA